MSKSRYLLFLVAILLLKVAPAAEAHKPIWGDGNQIEIPNLTTSFAAYRHLQEPSQIDTFVIEAQAGERFQGEISIPQVEGLEDYDVRAALFGPGLPDAEHEQFPPDHPDDLGALVFPSRVTSDFFEPFTQTSYWGRQPIEVTLPATGTYYLLVWQPDDEPGKYVLATSGEERFSFADIFRFPLWWIRVHVFFNHTLYLLVGAAFLMLGLATGIWYWRRNQRQHNPTVVPFNS